jgi:hypothetical protein
MNIELNKTYRTRSGQKCRIICVDRTAIYSVVGLLETPRGEETATYMPNGVLCSESCSPGDLISEWEDKPEYDRSLLPAWANKAITMDRYGTWHCYDIVPDLTENTWMVHSPDFATIPPSHAPKWKGDWKDSLLTFED